CVPGRLLPGLADGAPGGPAMRWRQRRQGLRPACHTGSTPNRRGVRLRESVRSRSRRSAPRCRRPATPRPATAANAGERRAAPPAAGCWLPAHPTGRLAPALPSPCHSSMPHPVAVNWSPDSSQATAMARLQLDFSQQQFIYQTCMTVRSTDINGANHLGNDAMISMISEARARFLFDHGIRETADNGTGIIVTDLATLYRAESHARDRLLFEVGV